MSTENVSNEILEKGEQTTVVEETSALEQPNTEQTSKDVPTVEPHIENVDTEHLFDDILEKGEYIVKIIKPSKKRYWMAPLLPFGIPLFWPHFILIMALTLFTLPLFYARGYKNLYYAYTNKRLITRSGMIGVDFHSVGYKDMTSSSVKVDLLDKIGKTTGTLFFKSMAGAIQFRYIEKPYELLREIKDYMDTVSNG